VKGTRPPGTPPAVNQVSFAGVATAAQITRTPMHARSVPRSLAILCMAILIHHGDAATAAAEWREIFIRVTGRTTHNN